MGEHELYFNLGDSRWLVARCSCGRWERDRMLRLDQRPSELVREIEAEFEEHTRVDASQPYLHILPTD